MDGCCKRCFRDDERFFFLPFLLNIRLIRTINIRVSLFVKHLQRISKSSSSIFNDDSQNIESP